MRMVLLVAHETNVLHERGVQVLREIELICLGLALTRTLQVLVASLGKRRLRQLHP